MGLRTQPLSLATEPVPAGDAPQRLLPVDWRTRTSLDWIIPLLAVASLLVACALGSRGHYFWNDEVFSWTFLSIGSLWEMMRVIAQGAEVTPPLYHIFGWAWVQGAGTSELSLRLYSSVGMSVALLVTWRMLRSAYPLGAAVVGVLGVFGASELLLLENVEGRFYGLLLAVVGVGCAAAVILMAEDRPSRTMLVANAIAHAAMAYTHTYGLLYSGAILTAIVAYDATRRQFRPAVYASVVGGWVLFLPWIPVVMRQAALARPHSQFAVPTLGLLFRSYWLGMTRLPLIIAALVCLAIVGRRIGAASRNDDASLDDRTAAGEARRRSMLFLAGALGAVPLLGFIVSHFGISIFQDRYMLPSVLGVSILLSHLAWVALSRTTMPAFAMPSMSTGWRLPITYRVGWVALAGWLLLNPIVAALGQKAEIRPGAELEGAMLQEGVMDLPVVSEDQLTMLPLRHYTHIPHDSLFLVTDWQVASDPRSPLRATVHMKVQELWHRLGLSPSVVGTSAFLCAHRRFVVVNEQRFFWFERRVQHDPAFEWHKIGSETTPIRADIILVQRRPDVPSPDCQ